MFAILIQFNLVHTTPTYICKIHFNVIHPPTSQSSYPYGLPKNILCVFLVSIRASCTAHLIILDLIILIILWRRVQVMKLLIM
jgi:hypothetical protein